MDVLSPGCGIWEKLLFHLQVSYCCPSLLQTHLPAAVALGKRTSGFSACQARMLWGQQRRKKSFLAKLCCFPTKKARSNTNGCLSKVLVSSSSPAPPSPAQVHAVLLPVYTSAQILCVRHYLSKKPTSTSTRVLIGDPHVRPSRRGWVMLAVSSSSAKPTSRKGDEC